MPGLISAMQGFCVIGIVIAVGYVAARMRIGGPSAQMVLNRFSFFVSSPCLMFAILSKEPIFDIFHPSIIVAFFSAVLVGVVLGVAIVSALRGGNTDGYGDDFDDGDHDASSIVDIFQSDVPTIPRADTDPDLRFYCEKAGEEKLTIQQVYQQVNPALSLIHISEPTRH